ncbi:Endopolyphosphatase Ppn1p-related protein [Penicillium riverlandense]|uniref:Endopolyphosphatase Ppn1p-related protein n=1 Tax=Penicillium riverlandense TaxID=1903569 RepID=UPI002549801B|nr:Endopolyphosphatase Ppn1p-related protein [Penicillium riverlandense]KAJ5832324.1 Endopolyphosphatase Ppn1p-related protein [Penicillium riverlandense]
MQSINLLLGLLASVSAIPFQQQLLGVVSDRSEGAADATEPQTGTSPRPLHGRFLHITDFHPDRHYKPGTSIDGSSCHSGKGSAGYFGTEGSECDSPLSLVNETFRWIEENLKDNIDFVIWTGDSARHDNDEEIPRTRDEVVELNEFMAQKWIALFDQQQNAQGSKSVPRLSVPVVPTIGNNDIMPHNIFKNGPNRWTKNLAQVWEKFIPEDQRHTFVEGGWFTSEVIPGQLAVISLNTMYFFESNTAVDGCEDKSEPGYEHMEWLRVQLKLLRSRKMKAILMGHVPPARSSSKCNWDETCWQKYTLWLHNYRDVVVGSFYGHMNIDHFMLQDSHQIDIDSEGIRKSSDGRVSISSKEEYLDSLREQWADLPSPPSGVFDIADSQSGEIETTKKSKKKKKQEQKRKKFLKKIGGPWAERYSVSLVAPSLVPNYFPTLRVIEYNITGVENLVPEADSESPADIVSDANTHFDHGDNEFLELRSDAPELQKKKKKQKKDKKKPSFKMPEPPSSTSPPGPAHSPQAFSLLGWTQYYANLTRLNEEAESSVSDEGPKLHFEVEYRTDDDIYEMKDLTVRSWFQLATAIADEDNTKSIDSNGPEIQKKRKNHVWRAFLTRAFAGYVDIDELDDLA